MLLLRIGILPLITFFATSARGQEDSSQDPQLQHQTESSVDNSASTPAPKIVFELAVATELSLVVCAIDSSSLFKRASSRGAACRFALMREAV